MQTIQYYGQMQKNANTDYNALATTSFMAPAQQKKTRGFVEFDLQLFRPEGSTGANAHEKRFEPYNYFPQNISNNKPVPNVHMEQGLPRDGNMYKGIKCSDALYDHRKHLNLTHAKEKGIL